MRKLNLIITNKEKRPVNPAENWPQKALKLSLREVNKILRKGFYPAINLNFFEKDGEEEFKIISIDVDYELKYIPQKVKEKISYIANKYKNKIIYEASLSNRLHIFLKIKKDEYLDLKRKYKLSSRYSYEKVEIFLENKYVISPKADIFKIFDIEYISKEDLLNILKTFDIDVKEAKEEYFEEYDKNISYNIKIDKLIERIDEARNKGIITGWDIDRFLAVEVIRGNLQKDIFKLIYKDEYDERVTDRILRDAERRIKEDLPVFTLGSIIKIFKDNNIPVDFIASNNTNNKTNKLKDLDKYFENIWILDDNYILIKDGDKIIEDRLQILPAFLELKYDISLPLEKIKSYLFLKKHITKIYDANMEYGIHKFEDRYFYNICDSKLLKEIQNILDNKIDTINPYDAELNINLGEEILIRNIFKNKDNLKAFYSWIILKIKDGKTPFVPLFSTGQGAGKDTVILSFLEKIFGKVSVYDDYALKSNFNIIDFTTPIAIISEADLRSKKIYDKIKILTGSKSIIVNEKYALPKEVILNTDYVIFTNLENPLFIDSEKEERRILLIQNLDSIRLDKIWVNNYRFEFTNFKDFINFLVNSLIEGLLNYAYQIDDNILFSYLQDYITSQKDKIKLSEDFWKSELIKEIKTGEIYNNILDFIDSQVNLEKRLNSEFIHIFKEKKYLRSELILEYLKYQGYKNVTIKKIGKVLNSLLKTVTYLGKRYYNLKSIIIDHGNNSSQDNNKKILLNKVISYDGGEIIKSDEFNIDLSELDNYIKENI